MRRRRYRKRYTIDKAQQGLAFWALLCLLVLLSFCYRDVWCGMVLSQTYFENETFGKKDVSAAEMAFAFVDGNYGYYLNRGGSAGKETALQEAADEKERAGTEAVDEKESAGTENVDADTEKTVKSYEDAKNYFISHFREDESTEYVDAAEETGKETGQESGQESGKVTGTDSDNGSDADGKKEDPSLEELMLMENRKVSGKNGEFVKQQDVLCEPDYQAMQDFDYLVKHYYTVDSTTTITKERLDAARMLEFDASLLQDASKPQILIYHTHSQEGFADSVAGDASTSIVGVGEELCRILREEYGLNVIHDTGTYDVPNRDYAYSVSAPAIEKILAENPSIEVIIDLHRDGVPEGTHLVKEVGGRNTAQFMFFNGISYLNSTGAIAYLENPYIDQNLAFSFQMKLAADRYYPGFCRNIYLKGLRYNMHYRPKSLLIEVGAQTNTVEEAMNAAEPLAQILASVLKP